MATFKQKIGGLVHPHQTTGGQIKQALCRSTTEKSFAVVWHGKSNVCVEQVGKPVIADPEDVIIRVTATSICGADLHLYMNKVPDTGVLNDGDILGHEAIGLIESVGSSVSSFKVGDRVVVSCSFACGNCKYCNNKQQNCCEASNPSMKSDKTYGHRTAGLFGYSHLTGTYEGCQAEFVRVPKAESNCYKIHSSISDQNALLLSDVLCTGWHGCELSKVKQGDVVGVWGCGPVGLACQALCKLRGASRVIAIDDCDYRLSMAKNKNGCETIKFGTLPVIDTLQKMCPEGLDACIDCAGYRYPTSTMKKIGHAFNAESDALSTLNEMVVTCKKGGRIALLGDYLTFGDHFPIGPFMEKSITLKGGQAFVQKYWSTLTDILTSGKLDTSFLITHTLPLTKAPEAYKMFCNQDDGCLKVMLTPQLGSVGQR